jgi:hypothetical protein
MTDLTRQQVTDLLAASEAKGEARTARFELDIKSGFADLRTEFAQVRTEMANDRAAASKQSNESQKWVVTAVFAMISIAVTILATMINYTKGDKANTSVAAAPAPIIITLPGGAVPDPPKGVSPGAPAPPK